MCGDPAEIVVCRSYPWWSCGDVLCQTVLYYSDKSRAVRAVAVVMKLGGVIESHPNAVV